MYSQDEILWLEQYASFGLSAEQKAILLLGRKGNLIAPQDIWDRLGLVDTEHYRILVASLQEFGILRSERSKGQAQNFARREKISVRAVPRFGISLAKDIKPRSQKSQSKKPEPIRRESPRTEDADAALFVGNLPPNVSNRDMIMAFESFGEIENVFVPKSGQITRGYGFIHFSSADTAQKLLREQPPVRMGPYSLVLRPATPRTPRT
jgi:ATP-dependent DNA helicase RecG